MKGWRLRGIWNVRWSVYCLKTGIYLKLLVRCLASLKQLVAKQQGVSVVLFPGLHLQPKTMPKKNKNNVPMWRFRCQDHYHAGGLTAELWWNALQHERCFRSMIASCKYLSGPSPPAFVYRKQWKTWGEAEWETRLVKHKAGQVLACTFKLGSQCVWVC